MSFFYKFQSTFIHSTLIAFFLYFILANLTIHLPKKNGTILFYSNKFDYDFEYLIATCLRQAKKSITIHSYGFYSPHLLKLLEKKQKQGIEIELLLDSKYIKPKKSTLKITSNKMSGLMHKKSIIIDDDLVFLGSTNITTTSLKLHNNLIIGIQNKELAQCIKKNINFKSENTQLLCTQDNSTHILNLILSYIDNAKNSIHLAMFTFTHKQLLASLIKAHQRGVKLFLYLDKMQAKGCCKATLEALKKEGLKIKHNKSRALLHQKLCLIDNKTLITGSLNWTKAGLEKNKELVLIIDKIDHTQKKALHEILNLLDA